MTILIPVDSKNRDECIIASIEENKAWAFVTLDEGKIVKVEFYERREDISVWIDAEIWLPFGSVSLDGTPML